MVQVLRPAFKGSGAVGIGGWTSTEGSGAVNLFQSVNRAHSESENVHAWIDSPTASDIMTLSLAPGVDPQVNTGHVLNLRWSKRTPFGADYQPTAELRQSWDGGSNTLIASVTGLAAVDTTVFTTSLALTPAQAALITDYGDLWVATWAEKSGGGGPREWRTIWFELEVPDPSPTLPTTVGAQVMVVT